MPTRVTLGPRRNVSSARDVSLSANAYWHLVYDQDGYLIYSFTAAGFFTQTGHNVPGTHVLMNIVDAPGNGQVLGHWAGKGPNSLFNYHTYAYALVTATDVTSTSMDSTYTIGVMGNLAESGANMQPNVLYVFGGTALTLPTAAAVGWSDVLLSRGAAGVVQSGGTFADAGVSNAGAIATGATLAVTSAGNAIGTIRTQPAAAVTGVILANGSVNGQRVTVFNESVAANTITFAVQATSHVADGVSSVIAGVTSRTFVWNSATSLWYPAKQLRHARRPVLPVKRPKPKRHFTFDLRRVRVVGGWALPSNHDGQVRWKDRTEGEDEPAPREWPMMRRKR